MSKFLNLETIKEIDISSIWSKLKLDSISTTQLQLLIGAGQYHVLYLFW